MKSVKSNIILVEILIELFTWSSFEHFYKLQINLDHLHITIVKA